MREALAEAERARLDGDVPVGAVVGHDGKVIGRGRNRREVDCDPTAHAEVMALREAALALGTWRLYGCSIYVTLEPCSMCGGAMVLSRIERCVYGCSDPKGGFLGSLYDLSNDSRLNHRFEVISGIEEEECSSMLRNFFKELRARRKS